MTIGVAVIICLILAGLIAFISIRNKANNTNMNIGQNNNTAANVVSGDDVAKSGDTVSMNYTGWLEATHVAFDSNVDPKFHHVQPFVFTLGAGQVIAGWDKGIVGMKVGERKTLTIPPADAYGANGIPGVIPPNSTLVFNVELLSIKK